MNALNHQTGSARRGFTMVELIVVVVVLGIVSASVIPAIGALAGARRAGAVEHVRATLRLARASAMLTGQPTGVAVNPDDSTLAVVWIAPGATAPGAKIDALGSPYTPVSLAIEFPGSAIDALVGFDGSSGAGTLWFGTDGVPERRDSIGTLLGTATSDAVLTLDSGEAITLDRGTGVEP